jgi:hypothetical protein
MRVKSLLLTTTLAALSALCAAEPLLGGRDFVPTPARPVGFRGDGTGCFPGATPPTQWDTGMLAMSASGQFPVPQVAGDKLTLGGQIYSFDGKGFEFAKTAPELK